MASVLAKRCLCCPGTSVLDSLKMLVPVACAVVGVSAGAAYIAAPLARGDAPRWIPVTFALSWALISILWSLDVYKHHREASYALLAAAERTSCVAMSHRLKKRMVVAAGAAVVYFVALIFYGAIAKEDQCGHVSCGADISWSLIDMATSLGWYWTLYKANNFYVDRAGFSAVMEMPASAKVGATSVEVTVA